MGKNFFGVIVFIGLLFCSCEKSLDYQLSSEDSEPVLYMFPMPDSLLKVYASYSTDILSSETYTALSSDAALTISLSNGKTYEYTYGSGLEMETYDGISFAVGDTMDVNLDLGDISLSGSTFIPQTVLINDLDTISVEEYNESNELEDMLRCYVSLTDPSDQVNYYQLRVDLESTDESGTTQVETLDYTKEDNAFSTNEYESVYITDIDYQGTFNDILFDGRTYLLKILISQSDLEKESGVTSKKLHFYLYSLTKDYYEYIRSLIEEETYREDPFYQQENLYSNVENGLGVIAGLSVDQVSLTIY